jgi:phosphatidylglycerol lysyltransferase
MRHGRHATAYQIINPGLSLWFSKLGDAVSGYVDHGSYRVTAAAPVCEDGLTVARANEFEQDARRQGLRLCCFGVEDWFVGRWALRPGYSVVLLGAQPAWRPAAWREIVRGHASLRAQLHRALNKGVCVEEMPAGMAADSPALHQCLEEWLADRGLPPMHFLVEPETLAGLYDRRVLVARGPSGVIGFLVAAPETARGGRLIDQIIRGRGAVNGTSELLVGAAMSALAHEGYGYATLGLAASRCWARYWAVAPDWWAPAWPSAWWGP